jgi:queuine tRNA-ribosyltransferase
VGWEAPDALQLEATHRTSRWLRRTIERYEQLQPAEALPLLFGIAQGGFDPARRAASAADIASLPVAGYAVGGLSVGEPKPVMAEMLAASLSALPGEKPRYLMGVGSPEDLWRGVAAGIDMFDCVHPTRVARRGALFTPTGRVNLHNARFQRDFGPVDSTCDCLTCRGYSAAYLHHLFRTKELLAYRLASIHNLRVIQRQMERMRSALEAGTFAGEMDAFLQTYRPADERAAAEQRMARRAGRSDA